MADVVLFVASIVAEYLVTPVRRHCGYVIFSDSYSGQLEEELEKLENARQRVQHSINEARNDVKLIEADVQKWVTDVETIANKGRDMLDNDGRAEKTCFYGWLPNPKARYRLGKKVSRTVKDIKELVARGQFEKVDFKNPPSGFVGGASDVNSLAGDGGDIIQELTVQSQFEKVDFKNPPPGLVVAAPDVNSSAIHGGDTIKKLNPRGHFKKVDFRNPPPGLAVSAPDVNSSAVNGGDTITDSRASIFQGIMKALHDEKHKVIGVYGPGGVGKTTLLKEVEKKLRKEGKLFDMIVKAEVSQTPDLNNIQYQIADALSLNLKDKQSQQGRRDLLFQRLQSDPNEKVLIILDNLWEELDLGEVGIPSGDESRGCRVLLTSRIKDVLQQKMCAYPVFHLKGLNNNEAFRLFEKTIGSRLKDDEDVRAIAPQVVKKLAGLPLLIISVASTLKCSDVSTWRNALIKIDDPNVETIVKLSYDHLKSEDGKSLFLLCGLIGGTIQVETLLALGVGLGLFEEFNKTIQDIRDRLITMLDSLRSACLLLDDGNDKDIVTIHDLYSEVVVSTPFRGQNSLIMNNNYGSWPKEKLENCWAICQVNDGSDRLDEVMSCQFPNLKILMLCRPENWLWMPAHRQGAGDCSRLDFTYMKELQVLYLHSMHIMSLPPSVEIVENLRSLSLCNCYVEDVAILGKLKALLILSFAGSAISRLPKEIGELVNLKSLNLSNCNNLEIIEPGVLKGLINLEELLMEGFDQWVGEDEITLWNARLTELKSLTKLTTLEIWIPRPTILFKEGDLPFGKLLRFWINIGYVRGREFEVLRTMKLQLNGCDSIVSKEWVQETLQKTQYLHLDGLREFKTNAHELCIRGFSQLKHLNIQNCPSIKYIASSSNELFLTAFTILESLFLENLINLEKICHGPIAPQCFSKLKAVSVRMCDQLKNLWCFSEKQILVLLEEIEVWECESMQAFIIDDAGEDKVAADDIVEFPNVRRLELGKLPNMTSFSSGVKNTSEGALIQVSLPSLEHLCIQLVGSFKRIWHSELHKSSFCKLATLTLENCSDLLHIFTSAIIGRLHNLKRVYISNCPSLESLFDCESLDSNTEQTTVLLPKLEKVEVMGARNLSHLVKSDSQMVLGFPSLKHVSIYNCSELRYLFPYFMATTLEKLETLYVSYCEQMTEVVPKEDGDRSKAEVMSFPCLRSLTLRNLDNLISFTSGSCSYNFPYLEHLSIGQCRNFGVFIPSPTSAERQLGKTAREDDESPRSLFNEMVMFPNIRNLEIEGTSCKELWNNRIPNDSFCKLEYLELEHCDSLLRIASSHMWKRLCRCLEILKVISCHSIEMIYESDVTVAKSGKLRSLVLRDLENLRQFWQYDGLANVPFPSLRFIEVQRCSCLEMLFPTFTPKFLGQIKELVVESCENMKLIGCNEECEEAISTTITFSELTALRLFKLPKFRSFLPEKFSLEFPSLQVLSRVSCGTEPDLPGDWKSYQRHRESEIFGETFKYKFYVV